MSEPSEGSAVPHPRTLLGDPTLTDENEIHALVHGFYDAVREDALIGPVFTREIAPDEWPVHLAKMCDFWSSTLLKTGRYDGRPLPPHLKLSGELTDLHFHRWLTLFRETARRVMNPRGAEAAIVMAERVAHSFRLSLAFHKGEDTLAVRPLPVD